ncbi:nitroreductase family deazaflavin-dependent oxidoreductase [Streptomyces griseoruber]|uniref:nitroreductase family deazaflavin-dependent oxidoreductase n=1 Tax=Streptomyces griseoruber TaxID=1943 RepID=UPI0006E4350E|nr:nitroreductase family deazaflavin-dependent oxidoreductase [Streptomyces griseoruber]
MPEQPEQPGQSEQQGETPIDSPTGWVAAHIRRYDGSGGKEGQKWYGLDTLLLTTRGRKSGNLRRTAVIYGRDGENVIVVGSNGGKPEHPLWYLNLVASPEAHVQIGEEHLDVRARTANAEEKPELWKLMTGIFPQYKSYQKKTTREIPVVILEPVKP